jgi:hypothetical protein
MTKRSYGRSTHPGMLRLCTNNHPATAKAATIAPTRTIWENNVPSLYLFQGQF